MKRDEGMKYAMKEKSGGAGNNIVQLAPGFAGNKAVMR
jgi:hypothetical protein